MRLFTYRGLRARFLCAVFYSKRAVDGRISPPPAETRRLSYSISIIIVECNDFCSRTRFLPRLVYARISLVYAVICACGMRT